jgi:hypothetical protein
MKKNLEELERVSENDPNSFWKLLKNMSDDFVGDPSMSKPDVSANSWLTHLIFVKCYSVLFLTYVLCCSFVHNYIEGITAVEYYDQEKNESYNIVSLSLENMFFQKHGSGSF